MKSPEVHIIFSTIIERKVFLCRRFSTIFGDPRTSPESIIRVGFYITLLWFFRCEMSWTKEVIKNNIN